MTIRYTYSKATATAEWPLVDDSIDKWITKNIVSIQTSIISHTSGYILQLYNINI